MNDRVRAILDHRLPNAEELEADCGDWLECCQAYIHRDGCKAHATPPETPSDAAMRAAEEFVLSSAIPKSPQSKIEMLAAIITRHLAASPETPVGGETAENLWNALHGAAAPVVATDDDEGEK